MACKPVESRALAFAYGITNDLTVSLRLPWVRRTGILEGVQEDPADPATVRDRGTTSGFGDVTVLGQYRFLNNRVSGTQAACCSVFKAPTGATNLVDPFGETFEAEFQPGSGSWDGLFGAAFSQRLTPALSFHANVLAIATGTGTQDTNLGNRFLYNGALAYRLFGETAGEPHSHSPQNAFAHAGHVIRGWRPRLRWWPLRTGTSPSTPYSKSTVSGTTSSEPSALLIRIQAAPRYLFRRVCA
jgi:hypothetical protein